ncbi:S41 family peptidase [Pontibacterium granulatum]|uniref:S41 family peptidase n=1 Tax=Pontibacterium granulatum TaxID=2036029 RepID=UPI00249A340B|nr:S41 family peptidase [Pontibacterium granulatum]MDI3325717.1 S41 family peptidase [Pontibacterium granulatum]
MKLRKAVQTALRSLVMASLCGVAFNAVAETPAAPQEPAKQLPLEELRLFAEVYDRIKNAYVEPVDDAKLLQDAVRGMLAGLDPHSNYMDAEEFESLQVHTSGEFGGLGIEVGMEEPYIRVITPIDDTPAQRAGVKAGDLITQLDDKPVASMTLEEAINLMRGEPGEPIILTILREGREAPLQIKVVRDIIHVASVKSRLLEPGYGYLRITQFQVNTGKELTRQLETLREEGELNGLVLDLRNNPGGVLQAAVDVSNAFLSEGTIVYTEGRLPNSDQLFEANSQTVAADLPLVVLINGGSASASEIVAGALQDQKRAVIMGTDSFGKGSVQTILPLAKDRAIKLTTARYFTPNGRSIQAQGIEPDIDVANAELKPLDSGVEHLKEKDLSGHLENGQNNESEASLSRVQDKALLRDDFQLFEALSLLKALSIVKLQDK